MAEHGWCHIPEQVTHSTYSVMRLGREKYVLLYLGGDNKECGEAAREMIGFAEQINTSVLKIN